MNKVIFFITRFSVLLKKPGTYNDKRGEIESWNIAQKEYDAYKHALFCPDRLKLRRNTLERITLPSILGQKLSEGVEVQFLILTSDILPQDAMARLQHIAGKHPFVQILSISSGHESSPHYPIFDCIDDAIRNAVTDYLMRQGRDALFATVRLDDDDALAYRYTEMLCEHLRDDLVGYAVSFPRGFKVSIDPDNCVLGHLRHWYFPKIALGLAYLNHFKIALGVADQSIFHIYNAGGHTKVDQFIPVILDARRPAFLGTSHGTNDAGGDPNDTVWLELPVASLATIDYYFPSQFRFQNDLPGSSEKFSYETLPDIGLASQARLVLLHARRNARLGKQIQLFFRRGFNKIQKILRNINN